MVELENLALNSGTAEPQHYKKNCTLQRHNTYTVLTIPRNYRTKVVVELKHLPSTMEPQNHNIVETTAHYTDTTHTLYLRYRGTTEPKLW